MTKSLYLRCEPGMIAERVLLTGDPARIERMVEMMNGEIIARNREFLVGTGSINGVRYSAISSGIGAPSAAIAVEEAAQLGAKAFVRVGTMMGIGLPMGCFVLATGAARFEGTSSAYLPPAFPAVPDWALSQALRSAGERGGADVRMGVTATYDAFYPSMAPALVGRGLPDLELLRAGRVVALDMETSLLFILGMRLGVAVASFCIVTNNADPFEIIEAEARETGEKLLIRAAFEGLADWRPV
ncbi:MAG: nucleoside phosphorylase [Anaerolineae bacterium]|nr:nucleoside phosphorylase [Anaerolineae bacterium]